MKHKGLIALIIILITALILIGYFLYIYSKENNIINIVGDTDTNTNIIEVVSKYDNPIIPQGFKKVDTDNAKWIEENETIADWNKGLVIEDELGNQFVWVPVDHKDVLYGGESSKDEYRSEDEVTLSNDITDEEEQIKKYGGFYIGRYEAGLPQDMQDKREGFSAETNNKVGIPVTKKGAIVWNNISVKNAIESCSLMYKTADVQSWLMTGRQWLTIRQWLKNSGCDVNNTEEWGNFSDVNFRFTGLYSVDYGKSYKYGENELKATYNMLLSAGATDRNMANNIYDLAGNVQEYTSMYSSNPGGIQYYYGGGYYDFINRGIGRTMTATYAGANNHIGFRIVLFIN